MPTASSVQLAPAVDAASQRDEIAAPSSNLAQARSPADEKPPGRLREWAFIAVICSSQYFVQGSLGYVLVPLHIIGESFGQGPDEAASMAWHVGGFSLTVGTFILAAGRLGDIYGSRRLLCLGWAWFGLWSAVCGFAAFTTSAAFFSASRALQGIGAAFILPNALAIAGRTYPPGRKKQAIFATFALAAPLGCVIGGAMGAVFAERVWWPYAIWINAAGCLAMGVLAYVVVPVDGPRPPSATFNWLGAAVGVGGLLLLNIAWNQAPIDGWSAPHVYVMLILGAILLTAFFIQEKRVANPILDTSTLNRQSCMVLITTGLGWSSFGVWIYYTFQFMQNLRRTTTLESAAQFVPEGISGIAAALATPSLIRRMSNNWLMVIASAAFFAGCLLQALAPVEQSYWLNTFWSFVITAWGMDISFPAATMLLSDAVPKEQQGVSASLINTVVNYSIAIGIGIAGTVEAQVVKRGSDLVMGYRAALLSSVGLSGLGLLVSIGIVFSSFSMPKDKDSETHSMNILREN